MASSHGFPLWKRDTTRPVIAVCFVKFRESTVKTFVNSNVYTVSGAVSVQPTSREISRYIVQEDVFSRTMAFFCENCYNYRQLGHIYVFIPENYVC